MKQTLHFLVFIIALLWTGSELKAQINVALNKTVLASSTENGSYPASNAVDGNTGTRWASAYTDNEWIYVDLGAVYTLTQVKLVWETALGKDFTIDISNDASTWVTVQTITGNTNLNNTFDVSGNSARYVRMNGTLRGTSWGYSLWEFEVYDNTTVVNLALNKSSNASSLENGTYPSSYAFDGLGTNVGMDGKARDGNNVEYGRWSSERSDPQWISVDLGALYNINEVKLYWEVANGNDYIIQVSPDGTTWTDAVTITDNPANSYIVEIPMPGGTSARYVRMYGLTRNTSYGFSLYELEVFGTNNTLPINMIDFSAMQKDGNTEIKWEATLDRESNFEIQRSGDGSNFATIGSIHEPSGSNGISNHYSFTDESPLEGVNYYRIAYTETGGNRLFTKIVAVSFSNSSRIKIYPNPDTRNTRFLRIELPASMTGKTEIRILSISGKVVRQQRFGTNNTVLLADGISQLPAGQYIIQVWSEKSAPFSSLFIVK